MNTFLYSYGISSRTQVIAFNPTIMFVSYQFFTLHNLETEKFSMFQMKNNECVERTGRDGTS